MFAIPKIKRLRTASFLNSFGKTYFQCSGIPVPEAYLKNPDNRVFAIYFRQQMVAGFILAKGNALRTLEVFANPEARIDLYQSMKPISSFTEITCFWIHPDFRRLTRLNSFVWFSMAFYLKWLGEKNILFGTCSSSLARLYGVTPRSRLIHQDQMNGKRTFIFQSTRKGCIRGFLEILQSKWKRNALLRKRMEKVGNDVQKESQVFDLPSKLNPVHHAV